MKFDSVIIGGGLAGLVCGLKLARCRQRCAIISSGQSALHFSSGSLDLLGYMPDGTVVEKPMEALDAFLAANPAHPYTKVADEFSALVAEAEDLLGEVLGAGAINGTFEKNHYRLTPMGTFKPTWLSLDGYLTASEPKLPYSKVALFNAEGFLDFYSQFIADELRRKGTECQLHTFNTEALEQLRSNPTEMRSSNIARLFDREENLVCLAQLLINEVGDAEAVLLPAVLGIERKGGAAYLTERLGRPVHIVATLPPSVPGIALQRALRKAFEQAGGVYLLGDTAQGCEFEGNRVSALSTVNHSDIPFRAENYILATGSYFSRGLVAEREGVVEPLFGVDTEYAENRNDWYDRNLFAAQPFEKFGVKTDSALHALKGGEVVENLYVIGAILSGFNPIKEGCGAGVSILTALKAVHNILK